MIESRYLTVSGNFSMKCATAGLYSGAPNKITFRRRKVGTVTTFSGKICGMTPAEVNVFNAVIAPIESPQYVAFVVMVRKWPWSSGAGYRCLYHSSSSLGIGRAPRPLNDGDDGSDASDAECAEKLGGWRRRSILLRADLISAPTPRPVSERRLVVLNRRRVLPRLVDRARRL